MSQNIPMVPDNQLVKGNHDFASLTKLISEIPQERTPLWWYIAFGISNLVLAIMLAMIAWLF
ncbi:MAG: hypothetical protein WD097_02830, partial [Balneolales bacterium]